MGGFEAWADRRMQLLQRLSVFRSSSVTNAGSSWCLERKERLLSSNQPSHSSRVTLTLTLSRWIDRMWGTAQTGPLWARVCVWRFMPTRRLHTVTIQTRRCASAGIYGNTSSATQEMTLLSSFTRHHVDPNPIVFLFSVELFWTPFYGREQFF